jgi:hypothetical protein
MRHKAKVENRRILRGMARCGNVRTCSKGRLTFLFPPTNQEVASSSLAGRTKVLESTGHGEGTSTRRQVVCRRLSISCNSCSPHVTQYSRTGPVFALGMSRRPLSFDQPFLEAKRRHGERIVQSATSPL